MSKISKSRQDTKQETKQEAKQETKQDLKHDIGLVWHNYKWMTDYLHQAP